MSVLAIAPTNGLLPKSLRKSCILRAFVWTLGFTTGQRLPLSNHRPNHKSFIEALKIIMSADAEKWRYLPQDHKLRSTKLPWYNASFEHKLAPSFRKLLEEWSGIAPEDVIPHIYRTVSLTCQYSPH